MPKMILALLLAIAGVIVFFLQVYLGLRSGTVRYGMGTFDRRTEPISFWLTIVTGVCFGALTAGVLLVFGVAAFL